MTSRLLERSAALALCPLVLFLGVAAASATSTARVAAGQRPDQVRLAGIREHLAAFDGFAKRNGGNRFAGSAGYGESARYVAARMRAAGYVVRLQEFSFQFVVDRAAPSLRPVDAAGWTFRADRDYSTLQYSGSGDVEAALAAVDLLVPSSAPNTSTSGCESSDFSAFPRGAAALLQRGTCTFRQKVSNAIAAGASAVVVFNEGGEGRSGLFSGTLGEPQVRIPVLATSFAVGDSLRNGARDGPTGVTVRVSADMIAEPRRTRNVIAESRGGNAANVVVVGAHLDSVQAGPGINDNGSGSAVILEAAETLAALRPANKLRFVWWGAEELGLLGSRHYVEQLSPATRRRLALYLNFDMVGSRNFVVSVYDGDGSLSGGGARLPAGSGAIERAFASYFAARRLEFQETGTGGSDHVPFAQAGIPVGGLFTGADGRKSADEAADFGGRADQPYDACYHRPCDTIANVNGTVLTRIARAAVHVIARFARNTSSVNRTG